MARVSPYPQGRPLAGALFALGAGALLAWVLLLARVVDTLPTATNAFDAAAGAPYSFVAAFVAGLLLGLGGACAAAGRDAFALETRLARLGAGLALLYVAAGAASLAGAPAAGAWAAAGAACAGASAGLMALVWARRAARFRPRALAQAAAWSLAVTGALYGAARLGQQAGLGAGTACAAALVAAAACLAWRRVRGAGDAGAWSPSAREALRVLTAMSDRADAPGARRAGDGRGPGATRRVLGMLWIPLAGLLFSAFITGLTWDPVASDELAWHGAWLDATGALAGAACAAAAVLAIARGRGDAAVMGILGRAAAPAALAVILVVPIVKEASPGVPLALACSCASVAGFALITLCALAELAVAARLAGADPLRATGAALAMAAAAYAAGLASIGFLGVGGRILCFVLEAALLAAFAISFAMDSLRRMEGGAEGVDGADAADGADDAGRDPSLGAASAPSRLQVVSPLAPAAARSAAPASGTAGPVSGTAGPAAADNGETAMRLRCAELGTRYGLSPREGDVLVFIARGHSSRFIAEELCISENTVRTHVRHIYEKTGVGSRDELFQLVDGAA